MVELSDAVSRSRPPPKHTAAPASGVRGSGELRPAGAGEAPHDNALLMAREVL